MHNRNNSEPDPKDQSSAKPGTRRKKKLPPLIEFGDAEDCFIRNLAPFRGTGWLSILVEENPWQFYE